MNSSAQHVKALALCGSDETLVEANKIKPLRAVATGDDSCRELQGVGAPQRMHPNQPDRGLQQFLARLDHNPGGCQLVQVRERGAKYFGV